MQSREYTKLTEYIDNPSPFVFTFIPFVFTFIQTLQILSQAGHFPGDMAPVPWAGR